MTASREPIRYTLTFPEPENHFVEVEASVPSEGQETLDLFLPTWTPGSYKIRDYSRHLEGLVAEDLSGIPLPVEKIAKNRWRVRAAEGPRVHLRYRLYARELSVRTNFVDRDFALLNGAATFLTLREEGPRPHEVDVVLPRRWRGLHTALPSSSVAGPHRFRAPDYDTLVDCPIYLGNPRVHRFEVRDVPHALVTEGGANLPDGTWRNRDVERVTRAVVDFWDGIPYSRYLFVDLIVGAFGGLEHESGSVLMSDRWKIRTREGRVDWLGLVAHELFHAWNGKRLRPVELGPFDYETERPVRTLWVVEGITSYYDDLLVRRAGLTSRKEYLAQLSKNLRKTQETPGRRVRSLETSSFDAWIKLYQPDENLEGSAVSYYKKGAVAAFLLDARIREASSHERSLDDAMRLAYQRFSGERGYTASEIEATFSEVAGEELSPWFDRVVRGTEELPYLDALELYGLRFAAAEEEDEPAGWLGATTKVVEGQLRVTETVRGGPAHRAGLAVDDEILALDGYRIPPRSLGDRLATWRPGTETRILVARRDRLVELPLTLGEDPGTRWALEPDPAATAEQKAARERWLGPDTGVSPSSAS